VRPLFDLGSAIAAGAVTIRAGALTRRNFSYEVVGRLHGRPVVEREFSRLRELALPFGDYRSVSFTIRQDTEARDIAAIVRAELVAGRRLSLSRVAADDDGHSLAGGRRVRVVPHR
jgi:hypothetical protein